MDALAFPKKLLLMLLPMLGMSMACDGQNQLSHLPKAKEALEYCRNNEMDTMFCILINMGIHSGSNRLFVWNFQEEKVSTSGLCAHGSCDGKTGPGYRPEEVTFSNRPESYCSSYGKYKVGKRAWSNWGINVHYKLHGLDSSNSNAFNRIIVLHSFAYVPSEEVFPNYAPTSWGCPMVSNELMRGLDKQLQLADRPVLLWIFKD